MKHFKNLLGILLPALLLVSCGNSSEGDTPTPDVEEQVEAPTPNEETTTLPDEEAAIPLSDEVKNSDDVLILYNSIPELAPYKIEKKDGKYVTQSNAEYEMEVLVDKKNGYIQFDDDGTGGGTISYEVVLFRRADKSPVMGINRSEFDGLLYKESLRFVDNKSGTWKDVTTEVMGKVPTTDLLLDPSWAKAPAEVKERLFYLSFALPRQGFKMPVKLVVNSMYCESMGDDKTTVEWCRKAEPLAKTPPKLLFVWDKASDSFVSNRKGE